MNRKAIVVYVDNNKFILEEFSWLYKTWVLYKLYDEYDIVVYHNPEVGDRIPTHPNIDKISLLPMGINNPMWNKYKFVNSFSMFNDDVECERISQRYDYILKTDCDVFLTENMLGQEPDIIMIGRGGYMMREPEEVMENLVRIQKKLNLNSNFSNHIGASIFGPTDKILKIVKYHFKVTEFILKTEWTDGNPGKWPGWYKGVASMYAIHLVVNHFLSGKEIRLYNLDDYCYDNKITKEVLHIHAWHTDNDFSKHKWYDGKYEKVNYCEIPKISKDFCLCVVSNTLDELQLLLDGKPKVLKKINVMMPVYNTKYEWLKEAVDSVCNQSIDNWRLIIVNDGSTNEDTLKYLSEIENNPKVSVIHQTNMGIANARNTCLDNLDLDCQYVALLDSDDTMVKNRLEIQYDYMEKNQGVGFLGSRISVDGVPRTNHPLKITNEVFEKSVFFVNNPTAMIRKSTFDEIGNYSTDEFIYRNGGEDYDFLCRCYLNDVEIHNLSECLTEYRLHSGQMTRNREENVLSVLTEMREKTINKKNSLKNK